MPKKPCFVANWKMNKGREATRDYLSVFLSLCSEQSSAAGAEIIISPPFTGLDLVSNCLKQGQSGVGLAAQNVHFERSGAYTGEISAEMLCEMGCRYVIIGHSERRSLFSETDEVIHKKLHALISAGLLPILCIGETLKDRRAGKTWGRLEGQLSGALSDSFLGQELKMNNISDWVVAYEPVWAIGSGETPDPSDVNGLHEQIKYFFERRGVKDSPRIIYGGSVSEKNIEAFMKEPQIDGVLVGGASLSAATFFNLIQGGTGLK